MAVDSTAPADFRLGLGRMAAGCNTLLLDHKLCRSALVV
jgi:hypothetical protein